MNTFKIYAHPVGSLEAVKQGWSWPAFFFTFIWALVKKMWKESLIAIGVFLVLTFIVNEVGSLRCIQEVVMKLTALALAIAFGAKGNVWRVDNLVSRGFDLKGTIVAENDDSALAIYLKGNSTEANNREQRP